MTDRTQSVFRRQVTLEAVKDATGGVFDADAYHVMNERDDQLIADELINGALSSKFVYDIPISGGRATGVSVIGARHLAEAYGGIRHRLVGSVSKTGLLFTFKSYPTPGMPMTMSAARIAELGEEPDFYEVLVEVEDVKRGNIVQMERRETRYEKRSADTLKKNPGLEPFFERPHYATIAQSKAYRNGVLALVPQDFRMRWEKEALALGKGDNLVGSVIAEKRSKLSKLAAEKNLTLDRHALGALTMEQVDTLGETLMNRGAEPFSSAASALGILAGSADPETGEVKRTVVALKTPDKPKEGVAAPAASAESTAKPAAKQQDKPPAPTVSKPKQGAEPEKPATQEQKVEPTRGTFEAYLLDQNEETVNGEDGDPLYFADPVAYATALANYLMTAQDAAKTLEANATYVEASSEASDQARDVLARAKDALGAKDSAGQGQQDPEQDPPAEGADEEAPDFVVRLERAANNAPKLSALVAAVKEALASVADDDLDVWVEQNEAYWATEKLPTSTLRQAKAAIEARRASVAKPDAQQSTEAENRPPVGDDAAAKQWKDMTYLLEEIAKIKDRSGYSLMRENTALRAIYSRLKAAGRTDLLGRVDTASEAKRHEVGYQSATGEGGQ